MVDFQRWIAFHHPCHGSLFGITGGEINIRQEVAWLDDLPESRAVLMDVLPVKGANLGGEIAHCKLQEVRRISSGTTPNRLFIKVRVHDCCST